MVDNKNEVVAKYIEILNKDGVLEGYIISDYVTGKVYEYASGGSVLFDLISKANLDWIYVNIVDTFSRTIFMQHS